MRNEPAVTRTSRAEEDAPLFPAEPPPWFPRAVAWLLILLFAVVLVAAIVVRVPETVQSRFVLLPEGGVGPVQAPRNAVVESVLVREGQRVRRGDRLFVLRVDQVREWRADTEARQQALRSVGANARKLDEAHADALRIKDAEIDQARREVAFRGQHLAIMRDLVQRAETLARSGLISDIELASHRLRLSESEKDLEVARKTLSEKTLERGALETERARQRIAETAAADELSMRIASMKEPLASSTADLLEVRAPYDAVCLRLMQTAGRVVAAGDELCQLSPTTRRLQAKLQLPESGLPRLATRQRIRFLFDAFPYQRYGAVNGVVDWISPAAVARSEGAGFVALASLEKNEIRAGGSAYPLEPGMQGQARITVGRRALIEYLIEPLRQVRENLRP